MLLTNLASTYMEAFGAPLSLVEYRHLFKANWKHAHYPHEETAENLLFTAQVAALPPQDAILDLFDVENGRYNYFEPFKIIQARRQFLLLFRAIHLLVNHFQASADSKITASFIAQHLSANCIYKMTVWSDGDCPQRLLKHVDHFISSADKYDETAFYQFFIGFTLLELPIIISHDYLNLTEWREWISKYRTDAMRLFQDVQNILQCAAQYPFIAKTHARLLRELKNTSYETVTVTMNDLRSQISSIFFKLGRQAQHLRPKFNELACVSTLPKDMLFLIYLDNYGRLSPDKALFILNGELAGDEGEYFVEQNNFTDDIPLQLSPRYPSMGQVIFKNKSSPQIPTKANHANTIEVASEISLREAQPSKSLPPSLGSSSKSVSSPQLRVPLANPKPGRPLTTLLTSTNGLFSAPPDAPTVSPPTPRSDFKSKLRMIPNFFLALGSSALEPSSPQKEGTRSARSPSRDGK